MNNQNKIRRVAIESIRWLGFLAGMTIVVVVLLFPHEWTGLDPGGWDIGLTLGLILAPAFVSAVLSLVRRYWLLIPPALWFSGWSFSLRLRKHPPAWSTVFLVAAVVMLVVPFLSWALRSQKRPGENRDSDYFT